MNLLAPLLEPERYRDAIWITHRTPQSESMLAGKRAFFVPEVHARDWRTVLRRTPEVLRILARNEVDAVYSTGASLALATLPGARLVGARPRYVESLARAAGPSMTGRVLQAVPWVPVYTQYPQNSSWRWRYEHSLLDSFTVSAAGEARTPKRIFVALGTARPWHFRRLVERVLEVAPPDVHIVWQTGVTDTTGLPIEACPMLSDEQFRAEIDAADVVVSHAGVGVFMRCLDAGKVPILVPRRVARGEHVDDHQAQIAAVGGRRGLALSREVDELTTDDLVRATSLRVNRTSGVPSAV